MRSASDYEAGMQLASYACCASNSRGRKVAEPPPRDRTDYQRDRDRIVHCGAFRRLEYKTQVFLNHEGDLFRTRLTHSLEVAQIARSIARGLRLNEDLIESIALAHDLGHTPFGHAGQDALAACMRARDADGGGFEHNLQSLRVVDRLEERYAAFDGLNLTFETREGILKHCSRRNAQRLGDVAERFLHGGQPSLEAQITNLADEIAYNNHDIDDGLRSGLLELDELEAVPFFGGHLHAVRGAYPKLAPKRVIAETIRRMIAALIADLIDATEARIAEAGVASLDDVRAAPPLAAFSAPVREQLSALQRLLRARLYRHSQVVRSTTKAARVLRELFDAYADDPRLLPREHQPVDGRSRWRGVADYVAGMTDRYAIREHRKLFSVQDW
ncbi:deoxyguanosinetriphosphate triphosphohydrolase [mine drainage metagenome]|jgi:dGTPase|uniref:Deoxyguanosinetriphosphate triphosphohydrolase n=1 Tax=mine drainage metagenome TaxID=410659 RepID=A0A1J5RBT0_9ZZZZ